MLKFSHHVYQLILIKLRLNALLLQCHDSEFEHRNHLQTVLSTKEKLPLLLFPEIQNRIWNISVNPCCNCNKIFFIFGNLFFRNPWYTTCVITVGYNLNSKVFCEIFISLKIFRQKNHIGSSVWIIFGKLFLLWSF